MRQLDEQLKVQRRNHDTTRLGYIKFISSAKQGESSKHGEKRNEQEA